MTENKLKLEIDYDDGLTTYTLIDTSTNADYPMNELLTVEVYDGNFKHGSEDIYHDKVKKFIKELIEVGDGWND